MKKFIFPLQPLVLHRKRLEEEAKNAFLNKQAEIFEIEAKILALGSQRGEMVLQPITSIPEHHALEVQLQILDDEERMHQIAIGVLRDEAETLRQHWIVARQELEAVLKLREKAHHEWVVECEKAEQRELDEWATQRRAA